MRRLFGKPSFEDVQTSDLQSLSEATRVKRERMRRWAGLLIPFLSLQAAAQVVTVLAGFVVVRGLPVSDFAIYALVTALQAALAVLSDTGITTLLVARAGSFHGQVDRLAELVATARHGRRRLELVVLFLSGPLLYVWLRGKGLSGLEFGSITAIVMVGLHLQVSASLYITVPLILLDVRKVQIAQLAGAATRLTGLGAVVLFHAGYLWALAVNLLGLAAQAALSKKYAAARIKLDARKNEDDWRTITAMVRTQIVNAVYYAFSTQLTVWIIGLLGTRRSIAEVGALARLGSVLVLGQAAVAALAVPRFARMTEVTIFRRRYLQVTGLVVTIAGALFGLALVLPRVFLWFLGSQYAGLTANLPLAIASAATTLVSTTIFVLNSSRAWIARAWVAVPLILALQVVMILELDISTVRGALIFGWLSAIPPLIVNSLIALSGIKQWERERTS